MWLTCSSIGRKLVMAITGACLILFVTFHAVMNGVALFWPTAYNMVCEFLGANWYALIASAGLGFLMLLHIVYACWLTLQNRKARGNDRYAVVRKPKEVEWASQNMLVLGVVFVAFAIVHLTQFWAKMQLPEALGCEPGEVPYAAGTTFIEIAFSQWWTLPVYVIGFVALWLHMTHGFWSMFQSAGWNNETWMPRLKCIGNWWTTIVIGLFLVQAVVFTIKANDNYYTTEPALIEQIEEMKANHEGVKAECPQNAACEMPDCDKAECAAHQQAVCENPACEPQD